MLNVPQLYMSETRMGVALEKCMVHDYLHAFSVDEKISAYVMYLRMLASGDDYGKNILRIAKSTSICRETISKDAVRRKMPHCIR
jgi:hypothetical protein